MGPCYSGFGQLHIGPKAGIQAFRPFFDKSEGRDDLKFGPKLGFNFGFVGNVEVKENFSLRFEFAYSQKGKHVTGKIDRLLDHTVVYNHIDFPLLFTRKFDASFGANGRYQWYVNAGPNVSYWLNGSGVLESSELRLERDVLQLTYNIGFNKESSIIPAENEAIIQQPNRFQLGLNIGGGLIFKTGENTMLVVDARLEMGSTFVGKSGSEVLYAYSLFDYIENLKVVNGGLKLSVAYLFDLNLSELKKGKSTKDKSK